MSYWLNQKKHCDVLIKGAGITGLSVAYWLQTIYPNLKVIIQETKFVGAGASGRNAGFLTCGSVNYFAQLLEKYGEAKALEVWDFYAENHQMLSQFQFLKDCSYEKNGAVTWATSSEVWGKMENTFEIMKKNNLPIKKVAAQEKFLGGINYLGDASVNPVGLLQNMQKRLSNVEIVIAPDSSQIEAEVIIRATNGYTEDPNIPIEPQRAQVIMLKETPRFLDALGYNSENLVYFKQLPEGYFLMGGARSLDLETEHTSVMGENLKIQNHLYQFTQNYFPQLKDVAIHQAWSGIMGFTPDHQPVVGKVPNSKYENEYIIGGFSGHGMGMAFHTAKKLVESLYSSQTLPLFMRIERFNK